jgi:hypothetical protein
MRPSILLVVPLLAYASCEHVTAPTPAPQTTAARTAPAVIPGPQRARAVGHLPDTGFSESERIPENSAFARSSRSTDSDVFDGTARKAAKISIATGRTETMSLSQLITWCVAHDQDMRRHQPPIPSGAGSQRIPEENRNVSVTGWVHFAKPEEDGDYHLIVGTSSNLANSKFFNVEVSGLPPHSAHSFASIKGARESFEENFEAPTGSGYTQYEPTHVHIVGSLFYDIDHAAGVVGPSGYRPQSAWEIHPVTTFELSSR